MRLFLENRWAWLTIVAAPAWMAYRWGDFQPSDKGLYALGFLLYLAWAAVFALRAHALEKRLARCTCNHLAWDYEKGRPL